MINNEDDEGLTGHQYPHVQFGRDGDGSLVFLVGLALILGTVVLLITALA